MNRKITITYNGRDVTRDTIVAASNTEGWIEVIDKHRRYPSGAWAFTNRAGDDFVHRRLYGDVSIIFQGHALKEINFSQLYA